MTAEPTPTPDDTPALDWCLVEQLGHKRFAARVAETTIAGAAMLRCDIPVGDGWTTQFISGASLYALTPITEATARAFMAARTVAPIARYELLPVPMERRDLDEEGADDDTF